MLAAESAPAPGRGGFATVCGVIVDGKTYRYKCTVEGAAPGGRGEYLLDAVPVRPRVCADTGERHHDDVIGP